METPVIGIELLDIASPSLDFSIKINFGEIEIKLISLLTFKIEEFISPKQHE